MTNTATCTVCNQAVKTTKDGKVAAHWVNGYVCTGARKDPKS